jgi:hypothetical protein
VPVLAAPSIQAVLQDVATAWMRTTLQRGGCPQYTIHVGAADDAAALDALRTGWQTGTGTLFGPAPLVWFPDDYRQLNALDVTHASLIERRQFYASSALVIALPKDLATKLGSQGNWTMRDLADRRSGASEIKVRLIRPDPDVSALGKLATAAMYPTPDGPRSADRLDDAAVTTAMCHNDQPDLAFVLDDQTFTAAQTAPLSGPTSCPGIQGLSTVSPPQSSFGEDLLLNRAVALLKPSTDSGSPIPSPEAVLAAERFVTWLQSTPGQEALGAATAGFHVVPDLYRLPVPHGQALDPVPRRRALSSGESGSTGR